MVMNVACVLCEGAGEKWPGPEVRILRASNVRGAEPARDFVDGTETGFDWVGKQQASGERNCFCGEMIES